jgi:DNA-binding NarL/FixJ family response regulator
MRNGGAQETLRAAVVRAASERSDGNGEQGVAWRTLAERALSIVDHFDHDGRRYFVVRVGAARVSRREREVLAHVSRGLANKEIAFALRLAPSTVSSHLNNAMQRMGITERWVLTETFLISRLEQWLEACGGREPAAPGWSDLDRLAGELGLHAQRVDGPPMVAPESEPLFVISRSIVPPALREAAGLTAAEAEVAALAARGHSNLEIANKRGTSARTVANQMASILRKLEVPSRRQLSVRFASYTLARTAAR